MDIYIPKVREGEFSSEKTTLKGYIKWQVLNADGSIDKEGEHPNLILNAGLDKLATTLIADTFLYNCVGTGNSTPISTQVALDSEVGRTNSYLTSPTGSCGSTFVNTNTITHQRTFNWALGSLNTTLYEVGFSWASSAGSNLFSRSLFKDGSGNPTGVTVTSAQQLRVVYQLTCVLGDTNWSSEQTVSITGIGSVAYRTRTWCPMVNYLNTSTPYTPGQLLSDTFGSMGNAFSTVESAGGTGYGGGNSVGLAYGEPSSGLAGYFNTYSLYAAWMFVNASYPSYTNLPALNNNLPYNGNSNVSGTGGISTGGTYTNGTFTRNRTIQYNVNTANGNIQWIFTSNSYSSGLGRSHIWFFPTPIAKDNLHILTLNFTQTWAAA